MKSFSKSRVCLFFITLFILGFASCKKSNSDPANPQTPYIPKDGSVSATVGGNNWDAKAVYAVDSSNMIVIVGASSTTEANYPVILIAFPDNTSEGATINFNVAQNSILEFMENASSVYWAEPAINGGSGTLTITKFNKSTKRVEGNFSGVLKNANAGAASKTLSGGRFAVNYR